MCQLNCFKGQFSALCLFVILITSLRRWVSVICLTHHLTHHLSSRKRKVVELVCRYFALSASYLRSLVVNVGWFYWLRFRSSLRFFLSLPCGLC